MRYEEICADCALPLELCVCKVSVPRSITFDFFSEWRKKGYITVISFSDQVDELKKVVTELKKCLGAGGTIRGDNIELQGRHYDRLIKVLQSLGYVYHRSITPP